MLDLRTADTFNTAMATKRGHVSTGGTPGKADAKQPSEVHEFSSRRSLFCEKNSKKSSPWTQEETSALVQYISLYWEDAHTDKWPAMKQMVFWDKCAEAISKTCKNSRTGGSCRTRVTKFLSKEYISISEAEEKLNIDYILDTTPAFPTTLNTPKNMPRTNVSLSPMFGCSPYKQAPNQTTGDVISNMVSSFDTMTHKLKIQLLKFLFRRFVCSISGIDFWKFVSSDFLEDSIEGMKTLFEAQKHNLVLKLAKCFKKENEGQSRMPLERMPYGLIDYNVPRPRLHANELIIMMLHDALRSECDHLLHRSATTKSSLRQLYIRPREDWARHNSIATQE